MKFSDPDQTALKNYSAALRSWVRTLMGTKFFLRVQTGVKTHLVSCTLNIELLSQCVALTTRLEPKLETSRSVALLTPRLHWHITGLPLPLSYSIYQHKANETLSWRTSNVWEPISIIRLIQGAKYRNLSVRRHILGKKYWWLKKWNIIILLQMSTTIRLIVIHIFRVTTLKRWNLFSSTGKVTIFNIT